MEVTEFYENFSALPIEDFRKHYNLDFDSVSMQDAAGQLIYPKFGRENTKQKWVSSFPRSKKQRWLFWEKNYQTYELRNV